MRPELNEEDHILIQRSVKEMVELRLRYSYRYKKFDRVVCRIGGDRKWAAGTIMGLDEKDPKDPTGQARLPYVVKLDPPEGRLIAVHADESDLVRAEVCFGQC